MSTETDDPLDEMRRRIGELEAKAQAAGERANRSIKGQADVHHADRSVLVVPGR